ncbi:hypothetical protein IG631_21073 [Alternaria alternata]|nr:hypothetical protein IG631_21073 [Alternaria alternata]
MSYHTLRSLICPTSTRHRIITASSSSSTSGPDIGHAQPRSHKLSGELPLLSGVAVKRYTLAIQEERLPRYV